MTEEWTHFPQLSQRESEAAELRRLARIARPAGEWSYRGVGSEDFNKIANVLEYLADRQVEGATMSTIIKINLQEGSTHELPMGAKVLHASYVDEGLCLWLACDQNKRMMKTLFYIAATGWELPFFVNPDMHVATVINKKKRIVWHIFMIGYEGSLAPIDLKRALEDGAKVKEDIAE